MTSKNQTREAYVWIWLPNEMEPVVAGLLTEIGNQLVFNYGRSYLNRENAIAIYDPELPLKPGASPERLLMDISVSSPPSIPAAERFGGVASPRPATAKPGAC